MKGERNRPTKMLAATPIQPQINVEEERQGPVPLRRRTRRHRCTSVASIVEVVPIRQAHPVSSSKPEAVNGRVYEGRVVRSVLELSAALMRRRWGCARRRADVWRRTVDLGE